MDVLSLLRSKNRCLERFLEATSEFLSLCDQSDRLPELAPFEAQRDAIIKAIGLYDRKIGEALSLNPTKVPSSTTADQVAVLRKIIQEKDQIIHRIITADEQILQKIELEKEKLLKEIGTNRKLSQTVQKFRSKWVSESGEELDKKL